MAGVTGITGIDGVLPVWVDQPGVTLDPSVMGGPYNPAHGQASWDPQAGDPYSAQQGVSLAGQQPTVEESLLGVTPRGAPPGEDPEAYADPTATLSHGAPWPWQHIPDSGAVDNAEATAALALANAELHSVDSGDPAAWATNLQGAPALKMPWQLDPDYVSSGLPLGVQVGQLTGNGGTGRDRFAGWVVPGENLNRFGFDGAHVTRQDPSRGTLPVPDTSMQGAQRPMVLNIPGRYGSYPVGAGSPFAGQVPGVGNDTGAAEIGIASDYVPPPDVPTAPPLAQAAQATPWGVTSLGF